MTGRWLQPAKAAERLGIPRAELDRLIADGVIHLLRVAGDHYAIPETDVNAVLAERAAARPVVPRDPDNPAEGLMTAYDEDEFQRGKEDL
jgi:excisionase family DNA binding protein